MAGVSTCPRCGHVLAAGDADDVAVERLRQRCVEAGWSVSPNGVREPVVAEIFNCSLQTVRRHRKKGGARKLPGGMFWPLRNIAAMLEDGTVTRSDQE